MNMGTASLTREQLNEAVEQFAGKIMEALGATVSDEETSEPELTGTCFEVIDLAGEKCVMDAMDVSSGTLILEDAFEYFRCYTGGDISAPWVCYSGATYSHEGFAEKMREAFNTPRIVHHG